MDYLDFGRYLVQQRELRGLSREEVSAATRIPMGLIVALETGQVERLPGRVFVLNYIRAYARAIGLEQEEAVLRFEEMDKTLNAQPPPAALEVQRRKRALLQLGGIVALVAVAGYLYFAFFAEVITR